MITDKIKPGQILVLGSGLNKNQQSLEKLKELYQLGWKFISTGKNLDALRDFDIQAKELESLEGCFSLEDGGDIPDSRILSGILADRKSLGDMEALADLGIDTIDIVFFSTPSSVSFFHNKNDIGVQDIDVNLFSYLLAATKNSSQVNVVTDQEDLELVTSEIQENGKTSISTREKLAQKALQTLSSYFKFVFDIILFKTKRKQTIFPVKPERELASA